ncbi:terminase large subunit domain-containing protein [Arthrobacter sp. TMN-50]
MVAGPKAAITAPPLDFSAYPTDPAERRIRFIHDYLIVPRGHGAGEPVELQDFQQEIIRGSFAPGIRNALCSMPRGNAKTTLAAMLAVAEMFVGQFSAEVLVVASDQRQANVTVNQAKRMIALNPLLAERVQVFSDRVYVPHTDSTLTPLPAEPDALNSWDATLIIVDELHVVTREVWEAITSASGKRPQSLTLAISTPGTSEDSIMWDLVKLGRSGDDPAFFLIEFASPEGSSPDDMEAVKAGNPAMTCAKPFLSEDGLLAARKTLREPAFIQLRMGLWHKGVDSWLEFGQFEALADLERTIPNGAQVTLGFDGSSSGDSTALIACTVEANPHAFVVGIWENPGDTSWRVSRDEVSAHVDMAFETFDVLDLACDPWGWRSEMEQWAAKYGSKRVLEWDTSRRTRMAPATDRLYQLINTKQITHDGDTRLMKHFTNCVAVATPQGTVVTKDKRMSKKKIDAAVAAIAAVDRAQFHSNTIKRRRVAAF